MVHILIILGFPVVMLPVSVPFTSVMLASDAR